MLKLWTIIVDYFEGVHQLRCELDKKYHRFIEED